MEDVRRIIRGINRELKVDRVTAPGMRAHPAGLET